MGVVVDGGGWCRDVGCNGGGGDADFGGLVAAGALGGWRRLGVRVGVDLGCEGVGGGRVVLGSGWEGREDVEFSCNGADEGVGCFNLGDDGVALGID